MLSRFSPAPVLLMRSFAAQYSFLRLRYIRIEWSKKIGDSCIRDVVVNGLHVLVQVGSEIASDIQIAVDREDTFASCKYAALLDLAVTFEWPLDLAAFVESPKSFNATSACASKKSSSCSVCVGYLSKTTCTGAFGTPSEPSSGLASLLGLPWAFAELGPLNFLRPCPDLAPSDFLQEFLGGIERVKEVKKKKEKKKRKKGQEWEWAMRKMGGRQGRGGWNKHYLFVHVSNWVSILLNKWGIKEMNKWANKYNHQCISFSSPLSNK